MRPFERLYTMTDYYDVPRRGIANFEGQPHAYESPFSHWEGRYEDVFQLRPVDELTFRLALEQWAIWVRWEAAFYAGTTTVHTHPALPTERARHDAVCRQLDARLAALPGPVIHASAMFRAGELVQEGSTERLLEVQWTPVDPADGGAELR